MPARVTLTPSIDRWTEYDTTWASPVTEKFDVSKDGYFHKVVGTETKTTTETLSSQSSALEFLREIDVAFEARDLEPGETVHEVTFDGMVMECRTAEGEPGTITADENGVARGVFTIPPNVPAGAKTVVVSAHSRQGQAVFVGQGTLTVQTLRQVKQVTTVWVDPLAQTFVAEEAMQLAGVDLYFTAAGGDAQVQIREVVNGVPTRVVFAEAHIARADMVVTGGGHTRVLFDAPVALSANVEYALVVLCDDAETSLAIAVLGEYDELRKSYVTSQPYTIGVMLSSSNASTWTAHQDKDMAFRLLKADFTSAQAQEIDLGSVDTEEEATDMLLFGLSDPAYGQDLCPVCRGLAGWYDRQHGRGPGRELCQGPDRALQREGFPLRRRHRIPRAVSRHHAGVRQGRGDRRLLHPQHHVFRCGQGRSDL